MAPIWARLPGIFWETRRTVRKASATPICGPGNPCRPSAPPFCPPTWLSIDRFRHKNRQKRQGSQYALSLTELEDCLSGGDTTGQEVELHLLGEAIGKYLRGLSPEARTVFLGRYWFMDPLGEIARSHGISESKVKSLLYRTRQGLRTYLEKEGFSV